MNILSLLKGSKLLGRLGIIGGGIGTALTLGDGSAVELVSELTLLVGAITEGLTRYMIVKAKISGKLPPNAQI